MMNATRPAPRKAPAPPRGSKPPRPAAEAAPARRRPAAHPARLRLTAVLSAVALSLAALTLMLARSGDDDLPVVPGTRPPTAAPFYDGRTYESDNVRIQFTPPPPAPSEEETEAEPEEESP